MVEAHCDFNNSYMSLNPSDGAVNNQALGAGDLSCGTQASVQFGGGKRRSRRTKRAKRAKRARRAKKKAKKAKKSKKSAKLQG